jgi:hypothetical protein
MENKDASVPCKGWEDKDASAACDEAERLNPGWTADEHCRKHNHHTSKNGMYTVTIRRWVKP